MAVARAMNPEDFAPYRARLKDIKVPTLVIWGEQDAWVPVKNGHRFAEDIPGAKLEVLPRCGHMPQEEMPERTAELILDF
jgi:pimeloyl-ACP methyl ester carboxylesterase